MQQIDYGSSTRRDPAPSRWSYRIQRLWLTPLFRLTMRVGLPLLSTFFFTAWFLSDPDTRTALTEQFAEIRRSVAERPEFMVKLMAVDGASAELGDDIREILPVDFPLSSFDLDLDEMKEVVEQLDAVAGAELRIRPGGILQVQVTERIPAVVWRIEGLLELLDARGRRVAALPRRPLRADLPLIVGEGADTVVPEALAIVAAAAPLERRLRGLARMGERRWDLVLDRNQRILLPVENPVDALEQVIALDQARELLARDIAAVDMRNVQRPTLRMAPQAVEVMRRIKAIESGETSQ